MRRGSLVVVAILVLFVDGKASASNEINGLFDARSGAMGGTGVAFLDSAGAIPTNPALLDQVKKLTLSLDGMFIVAQPEAPYTISHIDENGQPYQTYETVRSSPTSALLPFIGGAYRLTERVVLGVGIYPTIGQGTTAEYKPAPDQYPEITLHNQAALGLVEVGDALSVRILDNLSVAAMWRITYMTQTVSTPVPGNPPVGTLLDTMHNPIYADIKTTGLNFAGLQLGVFYKPLPNLGLGFSYRNKVVVDGTGTTTTKNPVSGAPIVLDTQTSFASPHSFRAGLAWTVLQDKLLLAADFKYLLYEESWKSVSTTTTRMGVPSTTVTPTYWRNVFNVQLGAEYKTGEMFRLRAGYIMAPSATNPAYAQQFMAPPGVSHLVSAGLGIKVVDTVNVDLSAAYVWLQSYVDTATEYNSGTGIYASHAAEFSLSGTYHM
jgi:long-subunit fatty acid transport protein